jgi:hypothetical protein
MPQPPAQSPRKPGPAVSAWLTLLVVVPCALSVPAGLLTVALLMEQQPILVLVLVGALVWLPPVAVLWFGSRAASRALDGALAAWIVAAWIMLIVEAAVSLTLFGNALRPSDSGY